MPLRFIFIVLGAAIGFGIASFLGLTARKGGDHSKLATTRAENAPEGSSIVEIYTLPGCPYCIKAKALLDRKGIKYKEIDVSHNAELRHQMVERSEGRRTVPQIFVHNQHLGGYDDLRSREKTGELNKMMASIANDEASAEP